MIIMKQSQSSEGGQQSQSQKHTENKDNLDSRHKEEEMVKGNDLTNNEKENRSLGKSKQ